MRFLGINMSYCLILMKLKLTVDNENIVVCEVIVIIIYPTIDHHGTWKHCFRVEYLLGYHLGKTWGQFHIIFINSKFISPIFYGSELIPCQC